MLIRGDHYATCLKALKREERYLCEELIQMWKSCKIEHINLGCIGNSIAAGYSKCDEMLPLFARTQLYRSEFDISFFSFARVRRNEEINVLKWLEKNVSHSQINQLLLDDIRVKKGYYVCYHDRQEKEYQRIASRQDIGLKDYILLPDNIIIYSGLSGTFTDIFRKGDLTDKVRILKSFQKDYEYLKMILTELYLVNPSAQIYVCGLPNILGIGLSNRFDYYIKKAVRMVPNAVYVKGVERNISLVMKNQKQSDYHYNRPEYLRLLCEIWRSVLNHYASLKFKNEVLMELSKYNSEVEFRDTTAKGTAEMVTGIIKECEIRNAGLGGKYRTDIRKTKFEIWNYYNRHYLEHYGCTDRQAVRSALLGEN